MTHKTMYYLLLSLFDPSSPCCLSSLACHFPSISYNLVGLITKRWITSGLLYFLLPLLLQDSLMFYSLNSHSLHQNATVLRCDSNFLITTALLRVKDITKHLRVHTALSEYQVLHRTEVGTQHSYQVVYNFLYFWVQEDPTQCNVLSARSPKN